MSLESLKIDLTKQLFNLHKIAVLEKIKVILDEEEIVAYTVDGIPLSRESYIKAVKNANEDMENGQFLTHNQLLENIKTL
jgi:hypothetical protein